VASARQRIDEGYEVDKICEYVKAVLWDSSPEFVVQFNVYLRYFDYVNVATYNYYGMR
jgi:hypothetical protein